MIDVSFTGAEPVEVDLSSLWTLILYERPLVFGDSDKLSTFTIGHF